MAFTIILLFISVSVIPSTGTNVLEKSSTVSFNGNTLYVGGLGPSNYTTIQSALDDAINGDTVFVYDDSSPYIEHLNITKSIMITGENKDMTKIYGAGEKKDILFIQSRNVTVINFTIQYATNLKSGILVSSSSHVTIMDCKFSNIPSMDPITVKSSENITINNCLMSDSFDDNIIGFKTTDRYISGITLEKDCINTTILGNTISNASYAGIIVQVGCINTKITRNYIHSNDLYGIRVQFSNSTYITENIILNNNNEGIAIINCDNTLISRNLCENNSNAGVGIGDSLNTRVECNNFKHNGPLGHFAFNFGKGYDNKYPGNIWAGNYWGRPRVFPKPIFGVFTYRREAQSPIIIIPWLIFDWHPAKEPYDMGGYNEQ